MKRILLFLLAALVSDLMAIAAAVPQGAGLTRRPVQSPTPRISINGKVTDADGSGRPGVIVKLESPLP